MDGNPEESMFRRLLMLFVAGRVFGMLRRRNRGFGLRRDSGGWGSRHNTYRRQSLADLFGRRRRSFI
jgi:hypothetical protein